MLANSCSWRSMFMPARRSCSAPVLVRLPSSPTSVGAITNDFLALVAGLCEGSFGGGIVARAAQHVDADIARQWRAGAEQTNVVAPVVPITAGDRRHRLGLIDRS